MNLTHAIINNTFDLNYDKPCLQILEIILQIKINNQVLIINNMCNSTLQFQFKKMHQFFLYKYSN